MPTSTQVMKQAEEDDEVKEAADITTKHIEVENLKLSLEKFQEEIDGVPVATLPYQQRGRRLNKIAKIMQFGRQYLKQQGSARQYGDHASGLLDTIIEPAITSWLTAYKEEEYLRISKAVEIDKFDAIPGTHITTSVVDVAQSFMTTAMEWRCLKWQEISLQYCVQLAIEFAELADYYAHKLHDSLRSSDFESKKKNSDQFDLTDKVCLVINNIERMHKHLKECITSKKYLGLQEPGAVVRAMEEDIESQILDIVNTVAHMMREHLAQRLFAIPGALEADMETAFDVFTEYLLGDINRVICMINTENQKRLLGSIRDIVMKELLALVKQEMKLHRIKGDALLGKDHYTELLMRCEDCWNRSGVRGLSTMDLQQCDQKEMILWQIDIHLMTTDDVISEYMNQKIDLQSTESESCGTLTATVSYLDTKNIEVSQIGCSDFLQMYNDGTSDVFIRMSLYPPHLLDFNAQTKTRIHAPREAHFEGEIFEIPIPEESCTVAYLHFTLINRHMPWPVSTEEVIGEAYFKFSDFLIERHQDAVVKLTLPQYKPGLAGDLFDVLTTWSDHDKIATRFTKTQNKLAENSKDVLDKYTRARCPCFAQPLPNT